MSWEARTTVKKGNIGEDVVEKFLESKGWIVYSPSTAGAHGFDKFAMKDKAEIVYVESKAKARRKYYEDTGINISHYNDYTRLSEKYNMNIFIFFIDEYMGKVYGNFLSRLIEQTEVNGVKYPLRDRGIIYFPLKNMRMISDIDEKIIEELKTYSTRSYDY